MKTNAWIAPFVLALATVYFPSPASAALLFNGSYSQDFNSLSSVGNGNTWTDNSTISGWYSDEINFDANAGNSTSGGLYSFGTGTGSDRALGSIASSATATLYFGLALQNTSGGNLTALSISYRGEQWRRGDNANTLIFEYFVGTPTAIGSTQGGWTGVPGLNFTGPQSGTPSTSLDGNNSANYSDISFTITGLNIANNGELWFRWRDADNTGDDAGLAIDNFTITAVPEPTHLALGLFGIGLLAVSGTRAWLRRHP